MLDRFADYAMSDIKIARAAINVCNLHRVERGVSQQRRGITAVSYTHLTLPTIYSV